MNSFVLCVVLLWRLGNGGYEGGVLDHPNTILIPNTSLGLNLLLALLKSSSRSYSCDQLRDGYRFIWVCLDGYSTVHCGPMDALRDQQTVAIVRTT